MLNNSLLSLQRKSEVARFDSIILSDTQANGQFRTTVLSALQLIKDLDGRRFHRVQRYIAWIVNCPLPFGGAQYHYKTRTCRLDFEHLAPEPDPQFASAIVARALVHEATHGLLHARGVPYSAQLRSRVERCCWTEENRFLMQLAIKQPAIAQSVRREFIESRWRLSWRASPLQSLAALGRRLLRGS